MNIAEEHWLALLYLKLAKILRQYFIKLQVALRRLYSLKL